MPKRRDSRSVVLVAKGAAAAAAFTPLVAVVNAQPAAADFSHCPGVFPPPGWTNLTGDADGAFVPGTSTSYRNSTYYRYTWNSCYQGQQNLWTQSGLQLYDVNNAVRRQLGLWLVLGVLMAAERLQLHGVERSLLPQDRQSGRLLHRAVC